MTLLDSLLDAIVRLDGDALVMHVGEKPYVVTTSSAMNAYRGPLAWGQVELSSRVLTPDAVMSMVGQILPADQRHALEEIGAVEHEIAGPSGLADRFSVVAARGGDDIWLELRRHPAPEREGVAEAAQAGQGSTGEPAAAPAAAVRGPGSAVGLQEPPPADTAASEAASEHSGDTRADRPIEERVPVVDEVRHDEAEHIEHLLIPVSEESDAASESDPALELVEAEPQHTPTEEDVDAMLAATAASLLAANLKSDAPEADRPSEAEGSPELADAFAETIFEVVQDFEVIHEIEIQEAEPESAQESGLDLTSALDEMPAMEWAPETAPSEQAPAASEGSEPASVSAEAADPSEAAARAAVPDDAGLAPAAVAVTAGVEQRASTPEPPPELMDTAEARRPADTVADPQEARIAPATDAAAEAAPPLEAAGPPTPAQPTPREHREAEPSRPTETPVDHPATLHVTGTAPVAPKIAAGTRDITHGGVVVPIGRGRPERPDSGGRVEDERLQQILRAAAERGASTVYVVAHSTPMVRVDGEFGGLETEPVLSAPDIERLVAALAPQRQPGAGVEPGAEWISEVPNVGRVRCVSFRDHRGPGLIFRLISARSISAEQLNLSPEIRELCSLSDGLVLVAGARGSGKSTLLNSFVDLINRTRSEHVITVETEIAFVHESGRSFISQREVHDDGAAAAAAVSAALREDPDVLVVEDVQSADGARAVLHAAESGRLVFASITAASSAAALEAFANLIPDAERPSIRTALSGVLRAVVTQLLLRKASGGRVAARELFLNSPPAAASIRNGDMPGVTAALEAGQRYGMLPMNDALATLVRGGTVHGAEAYRRATDRQGLLASLARDGVDTSFAERLA